MNERIVLMEIQNLETIAGVQFGVAGHEGLQSRRLARTPRLTQNPKWTSGFDHAHAIVPAVVPGVRIVDARF